MAGGLNAKKMISLYNVKMKRKIRNRLMIHKIVFGILYLFNMEIVAKLFYRSERMQKKIIYVVPSKLRC